ncbi:MAG TPA: DUF72 domain-containing protein [Solirubrobacter sp.]|nr:DUF72 domain-containing protein [Solirubrobacter sp.]
MAGTVVAATAGWSVAEWYADGVEPRERLRALAESLGAVEADSPFYALPSASTVRRWAAITPDVFSFAVKLHRALSRHSVEPKALPRDLRDDVELDERGRIVLDDALQDALIERTLRTFEPLYAAGRLTCFVLQLTPAFAPGDHRLEELEPIVQGLAPVPVAVELRQRDWFHRADRVLGWYRDAGAVFACVDAPQDDRPMAVPPVDAATRSDLAYLRALGRDSKHRMTYRYSDAELDELAGRARTLAADAERVMVAFANGAHALDAARYLRAAFT